MVAQAQIVVGAEIQHFLTSHLNGSGLGALNEALLLVEACLANLLQRLLKMLLHFSVHDLILQFDDLQFNDLF